MYNSSSYTGTKRGHIFQDMNTGENYELTRSYVLHGQAVYNLHNVKSGKARVSDINRMFTKHPDMLVTAAELSYHFGLNLQPVKHISAVDMNLPDLRVQVRIDKAVDAVRNALCGMPKLGQIQIIVA